MIFFTSLFFRARTAKATEIKVLPVPAGPKANTRSFLLTRTRSKEDNRVVIVDLTAAGRDIAENTPLVGLPLLRRRLRTLPQQRLQVIDTALVEIMDIMEVTDAQ